MATRCCSPPLSLPGLRDCLFPVSSTTSKSSRASQFAFLLAAPGELHREHDVLGGRQVWHEVVALKDEADVVCPVAGQLMVGEPGDLLAIDLDAPARRLLETSEQAHEGALSAPAAADVATNSPSATVIVTPLTAVTVLSPAPNDFVTSFTSSHGHSLLRASAGWSLLMTYDAAALPNAAIRRMPASPTRMSAHWPSRAPGEVFERRVLHGQLVCDGAGVAAIADQAGGDRACGDGASDKADGPAEHTEGQGLGHELAHDPPIWAADRLEDPDLPLPFPDDHHHDQKADDRSGAHGPDEAVEGEAFDAVERRQRLVGLGDVARDVRGGSQREGDLAGDGTQMGEGVRRGDCAQYVVVLVGEALFGREWDDDRVVAAVSVTAKIALTVKTAP